MGFPSPPAPLYGGQTLNALSRKVEVPYPGVHDGVHAPISPEERRRAEEFIGCTLEQSYSEFTVELKNGVSRMLDDIYNSDFSKPARHRGHRKRHWHATRRVA